MMRILSFSNRDVERQLGLSSSYLSRLFSGGMELRFDHIVQISKAMGLRPEEVFQFAYPQPPEPPSDAMTRLRKTTGTLVQSAPAPPAPPPPTGPSQEELERLMAKTLRRFFGEMAKVGSD